MTLKEFRDLIEAERPIESDASAARHFKLFLQRNKTICLKAKEYITANLPLKSEISLYKILDGNTENAEIAVAKAVRWCRAEKQTVHESVVGPYIHPSTAKKLLFIMDEAIPIEPVFENECRTIGKVFSSFEFNQFLTYAKKHSNYVYRTLNHPISNATVFWMEDRAALESLIRLWFSVSNTEIKEGVNYYTYQEAAKLCGITVERLAAWLGEHEKMILFTNGFMNVLKQELDELLKKWHETELVDCIIKPITEKFPKPLAVKVSEAAKESAMKSGLLIPDGTYPQMDSSRCYCYKSNQQKLTDIIQANLTGIPSIPCETLPFPYLRDMVNDGTIPGETFGRKSYVTRETSAKIWDMFENYETLDNIVQQAADEIGSCFIKEKMQNRRKLLEFLEANEWWGVPHYTTSEKRIFRSMFDSVVHKADGQVIKSKIELWLSAYEKNDEEKMHLLLNYFEERFPDTCKIINDFYFGDSKKTVEKSDVDMVDNLFFLLKKDISEMTLQEVISEIVDPFKKSSIVSGEKLSNVLATSRLFNLEKISFPPTGYHRDVSAYSIEAFSIIVAYIVCPEIWREHNLVAKAVRHERYANLWLYVALNVFAAWRDTDYIRLTPPPLSRNPKDMLSEIDQEKFSDDEAAKIATSFIAQISMFGMTPQKTEESNNVSALFFSCPSHCLPEFGKILAIAACHYELKDSGREGFIQQGSNNVRTIQEFFGDAFLDACNHKPLSANKATKILLQSIEVVARDDFHLESRVAYHIASIVRSHKGSLKKLSETTEIYLRDSEFYGLSAEYVLYQLLERGVCSYVTDILLKKCYGHLYEKLRIEDKTRVIKELGLIPYSMDQLRQLGQKALIAAEDMVRSVAATDDECERALLNIAFGNAKCKSEQQYCICTALGIKCLCPERANGLGCKYEVLSKASLVQYISEYKRLSVENESDFINKKNAYLRDKLVFPKIVEAMLKLKEMSSKEEIEVYKWIKKEIENETAGNQEELAGDQCS